MCFLIAVFCLFLVSVSNAYSLERIVGGGKVSIENFPYQLSVRIFDGHICGGALIAARYGLSVAHCFTTKTLYSVRAGSHFKDDGGSITYIQKVFVHPERSFSYYDIAILEFQNPFNFSSTIQPIKLPTNDKILVPGISGTISGFGDTYNGAQRGSKVLMAAQVLVIDSKWCERQYEEFQISVTRTGFCAGANMGKMTDSCQGDSGGPFVIGNVLYGLVSFGLDCGDPQYPGVYTNVAALRDFIRLNTGI